MGSEFSCCVAEDSSTKVRWLITNDHAHSPPCCLFQQCTLECVTHGYQHSAKSFGASQLTLSICKMASSYQAFQLEAAIDFGDALLLAMDRFKVSLAVLDLSHFPLAAWDILTVLKVMCALRYNRRLCLQLVSLDGQSIGMGAMSEIVKTLSQLNKLDACPHPLTLSIRNVELSPNVITSLEWEAAHWLTIVRNEPCRWSASTPPEIAHATRWRQSLPKAAETSKCQDTKSEGSPEPRGAGALQVNVAVQQDNKFQLCEDVEELYRERSTEPAVKAAMPDDLAVQYIANANPILERPKDTSSAAIELVCSHKQEKLVPTVKSPLSQNHSPRAIVTIQMMSARAFQLSERTARSILEWHLSMNYWEGCLDAVTRLVPDTLDELACALGPLSNKIIHFRTQTLHSSSVRVQSWLQVAFSLVEFAERLLDAECPVSQSPVATLMGQLDDVSLPEEEIETLLDLLRCLPSCGSQLKILASKANMSFAGRLAPMSIEAAAVGLMFVEQTLSHGVLQVAHENYFEPFSSAMRHSIAVILDHMLKDRHVADSTNATPYCEGTDLVCEDSSVNNAALSKPISNNSSRFPHYMRRLSGGDSHRLFSSQKEDVERTRSASPLLKSQLPAVPLSLSDIRKPQNTPVLVQSMVVEPRPNKTAKEMEMTQCAPVMLSTTAMNQKVEDELKISDSTKCAQINAVKTESSANSSRLSPKSPRMTAAVQGRLDNLRLQQEKERRAALPIENKAFASITAKVSTRRSGTKSPASPRTLHPKHTSKEEWDATSKHKPAKKESIVKPAHISNAPSGVALLRHEHSKAQKALIGGNYNFAAPVVERRIEAQKDVEQLTLSRLESQFNELKTHVERSWQSFPEPRPSPPMPFKRNNVADGVKINMHQLNNSPKTKRAIPEGLVATLFPSTAAGIQTAIVVAPQSQPLMTSVVSSSTLANITNCATDAAKDRKAARKANPAAYFSLKPQDVQH